MICALCRLHGSNAVPLLHWSDIGTGGVRVADYLAREAASDFFLHLMAPGLACKRGVPALPDILTPSVEEHERPCQSIFCRRTFAALTFGGFMAPQLTLAFLCHDRAPRRRKAKSLEPARHPAPSKMLNDQSTRGRSHGLPSRRMIQQCQHRG